MAGVRANHSVPIRTTSATTPWLRWARWASVLAAISWAAVGLAWVYKSAISGDLLGAVAGAGLCLAVIILDCVAVAILRLGGIVLRSARRLEQLETRVAGIEALLDDYAMTDLSAERQPGSPDELVAANLEDAAFPRLMPAEEEAAAHHQERQESAPAAESELEELVRAEMERLREEFAGFVHNGQLAAALETGERISQLFPESRLAEQFLGIREHLRRRVAEERSDGRVSAV